MVSKTLEMSFKDLRFISERIFSEIPSALDRTMEKQLETWQNLDITSLRKNFALHGLEIFRETVSKRTAMLEPALRRALPQKTCYSPK